MGTTQPGVGWNWPSGTQPCPVLSVQKRYFCPFRMASFSFAHWDRSHDSCWVTKHHLLISHCISFLSVGASGSWTHATAVTGSHKSIPWHGSIMCCGKVQETDCAHSYSHPPPSPQVPAFKIHPNDLPLWQISMALFGIWKFHKRVRLEKDFPPRLYSLLQRCSWIR